MRIFWEIVAGILWRWDLGPNVRLGAVAFFGYVLSLFYVTNYVWGI